jgi:hypothetical protein
MRLHLIKCVLLGALVASPLGCEPRPVVVPDDDDTTVIEERETVVDEEPDAAPGEVDVNVGGERGVDVGVGRDAGQEADQNQNP